MYYSFSFSLNISIYGSFSVVLSISIQLTGNMFISFLFHLFCFFYDIVQVYLHRYNSTILHSSQNCDYSGEKLSILTILLRHLH